MRERLRTASRRIVENRAFGLSIILLILLSVVLIIIELLEDPTSPTWETVHYLNDAILVVFAVELAIRRLALRSWLQFFRECWIDILALLPLLRVFRLGRFLRLTRLLRLVSLSVLLQRRFGAVRFLMRQQLLEYLVIMVLAAFAVFMGTIGLLSFQDPLHPNITDFNDAFWSATYSMFAGEFISPEGVPKTVGQRVVAVAVMFLGMVVFAMLTGTVSALMVERMRRGPDMSSKMADLDGHVVICGWTRHTLQIIEVLRSDETFRDTAIVVIAMPEVFEEAEAGGLERRNVVRLEGDFTRISTLEASNLPRARVAIILADTSGGRSHQDADARTVLAALTMEKIAPQVHTCAEIFNPEYESHLQMGGIDHVVVTGQYGGNVLAYSAIAPKMLRLLREILTPEGSNLRRMAPPPAAIGSQFEDLLTTWKKERNTILLAVEKKDGRLLVNPKDCQLEEGDQLLGLVGREH